MRINGVGGLLTRITCILLVVFMVIPMSTDAIAGVFGFTYNIYNNLVAWGANWSGNIKSTTIKWSGQGISTVSNGYGWGVRVTIT